MFVFFQAEDGIRDLVRSRGLGDVYKRQKFNQIPSAIYYSIFHTNLYQKLEIGLTSWTYQCEENTLINKAIFSSYKISNYSYTCLLYTSDAADERSSVDLGGRRIIKKKKNKEIYTETIRIHILTVHRHTHIMR